VRPAKRRDDLHAGLLECGAPEGHHGSEPNQAALTDGVDLGLVRGLERGDA